MNSYSDLTILKARIGITGTGDDTQLRLLMEAASRAIDKYCHRWFYALSATRYYPGAGRELFLAEDDILSITTLKTDEDGDGTFENTLATTDYFLYPLNGYPKIWLEINPNGNYGGFGAGSKKGVEIIGLFGYGDGESATPYTDSGITVVADDGTETELDVSAEGTIAAGHTILVEAEQIYVKSATSDGTKKITVERARNGTTGIAHATKAAYIYDYPSPIMEAVIMTAARLWKRKDSAYARVIATPEMGGLEVYRGMDDDVKMLLAQYIKQRWF